MFMEVEYDEDKSSQNIAMRGLSFSEVYLLDWDNARLWVDERKEYGEVRYCALIIMPQNQKLYSVSFTKRGNILRIISFRRANKRERRKYNESES